jgi:hypothetical protein
MNLIDQVRLCQINLLVNDHKQAATLTSSIFQFIANGVS